MNKTIKIHIIGVIILWVMAIVCQLMVIQEKQNYIREIDAYKIQVEALDNQILEMDKEIVRLGYALTEANELLDSREMLELQYMGDFYCTAYCTEKYPHICGTGQGITASGQPIQAGVTVATGNKELLPFGSVIYIEGIGIRIVQDTGGGLRNNQLDIALPTHEEAFHFAQQGNHRVYLIKVGDTND